MRARRAVLQRGSEAAAGRPCAELAALATLGSPSTPSRPRPRVQAGRDWPAEMTCLSLPRPSAA
jgi:hypothetical protein